MDRTDFVFVVDHSDSMGNNIDAVEQGLTAFTDGLQSQGIDARFALVLFGGRPEVRLDFTPDAAALAAAFHGINILTPAVGGLESGLETIRMVLGAANVNFTPGQLVFRPDAIKNIVLVTDEDSDLPRFPENRVNGQTNNNPPQCGSFAGSAWQIEVDLTAQAVIAADAFVNMLVLPSERAVPCQYGDPAADQSNPDLTGFNPSATLDALENFGLSNCLQAQVLRAGLIGRTFQIRNVSQANFVDNFFDAKIEEVVNPCGAIAAWNVTVGAGTPGPAGVPSLVLTGAPAQGSRVEAFIGNPLGQPSLACMLVGGPIDPPAPTRFGFDLLVDVHAPNGFMIPLSVPAGGLRLPWDIETGIDSCGRTYFVQVVMLQGPEVAASERLRAVVGD